jgi:hypothetical protein
MMKPSQFKSEIVEVLFERLKNTPNNLANAFSLIWAVDVYAVHVARDRGKPEIPFKDKICNDGGWQFKILREASNATKHAIRKGTQTDVDASDKVSTSQTMVGWAAWVAGSDYVGQQICIDVAWKRDDASNDWIDAKGKSIAGRGPTFSTVTILDLIQPAITSIEMAGALPQEP